MGRARSGRVSDSVPEMEAAGGWRAQLTTGSSNYRRWAGSSPGTPEMLSQRAEDGQDEEKWSLVAQMVKTLPAT